MARILLRDSLLRVLATLAADLCVSCFIQRRQETSLGSRGSQTVDVVDDHRRDLIADEVLPVRKA